MLQPYRQKSIAKHYNEKLAPRYYGSYMIKKKIGASAYEVDLSSHSCIHLVFYASKIKRSIDNHQVSILSPQISADLELVAKPKDILEQRYNAEGKLEVLINWDDLPSTEATWAVPFLTIFGL